MEAHGQTFAQYYRLNKACSQRVLTPIILKLILYRSIGC
jgi:hypothetical protein